MKTSLATKLGFSPTIGKDDVDSELGTKQVTGDADIIFAPHRSPEVSSLWECHDISHEISPL